MSETPKAIRDAVKVEQWRQAAIDKATAPPGHDAVAEPRTSAEAFVERMREQRQQEDDREQRVNRLSHENPSPPVDDELRAFAQRQKAGRRRARRRGVMP
jgi:hypothetical protein